MRNYWKTISACLLILLLIVCSVFFYVKANESEIHIQVGIPLQFDETGHPLTVYYDAVAEKQDARIILLAMVNAIPLLEEDFPEGNPDAMIVVRYEAVGYPYQVWFTEDSVIFGNYGPDAKYYKEFFNDHTNVIPLLKNIVNLLENNQKYA